MMPRSSHIPDDELLLLLDSELSAQRTASLLAHLAVCPECEGRQDRMKRRLAEVSTVYCLARLETWDASGPRALLRARLIERRERKGATISRWRPGILTESNFARVCVLIVLTAIGFQVLSRQQRESRREAGLLPDPRFTPGSTRQANLADLCAIDKEEVVRHVPTPVVQQIFQEYGIRRLVTSDFEVDYLITPGLGGSDDVRNLWPEPHSNVLWSSYVKDQLEDRLHRMVCERKITLDQAQRDIASNWISAYKKYFQTDKPLARAHPSSSTELAVLR
jgi:hypothetical protein